MKKIFRNSTYLLGAQSLTKVISLIYTIYLANNLGISDYGLYTVATSYYGLVSTFSDFGISRYLMREVGKDHGNILKVLSTVTLLRLTTASVIFGFTAVIFYIFDPDKMRVALTLLAIAATLPQAIALTLDGVFVALQKISISAIGFLLMNVVSTLIGFFLVFRGYGVMGAVYAVIFGQIIYVGFLLLLFEFKIQIFRPISTKIIKEIIFGSLPYGFLGVLGLVFFRIDTLFVNYMKGEYATGIYGAAYKFLDAIVFVPTTVGVILFPILAKMHTLNSLEVKKTSKKIIYIMGTIGLIFSGAFWIILPTFIKIFLPKFNETIGTVDILAVSIPFMFIHVVLAQILLSSDKYLKPIIKISAGNVLFNIILNFLLIPKWSYFGAAWSTVASDLFSFVVLYLFIQKRFSKNGS